jgi:AcrR family transcriptional regulator
MPKIEAATVAEHRRNQRGALLAAARELLLRNGADAVTPAALGQAVGLARNSVYKYFGSSRDILGELVEASFRDWAAEIHDAMAAQDDPRAQVGAYIVTTLDLAAAGQHRIAAAVAAADLPEPCRARIGELHRKLTEPLLAALRSRGDVHPEFTAALLQGTLDGAIKLVDSGAPPDDVRAATTEFLRRRNQATTHETTRGHPSSCLSL